MTQDSQTECPFLHLPGICLKAKSIVSIVTAMQAKQPGIFLFSKMSSLLFSGYQELILLAVKQLEHQIDHSFPSSAKVNEWSCMSGLLIRPHDLNRDSFAFTSFSQRK